MLILAGSYTSMGGPGLVLMGLMGDKLEKICENGDVKEPIWAEQGRRTGLVYIAAAQADGRHACVAAFRVQEMGMELVSVQTDDGLENCHLCLNEEETFLYSANYGDGTIAVFPLSEDGKILPCVQFVGHTGPCGPNKARQEGPHAHQVAFRPGTQELFLCDLGTDSVTVYRAGADGLITPAEEIPCRAGTGPRHLCFDGPDAFYLAGELGGWLSRFEKGERGWQCVQMLSSLPENYQGPENTAAAVRQDAGHVYVTNRGHNSVAVFPKNRGGRVEKPFFIRTPGAFPRDMILVPGGFLLAQQNSGTVSFMADNGMPGGQLKVPGAVSLLPLRV